MMRLDIESVTFYLSHLKRTWYLLTCITIRYFGSRHSAFTMISSQILVILREKICYNSSQKVCYYSDTNCLKSWINPSPACQKYFLLVNFYVQIWRFLLTNLKRVACTKMNKLKQTKDKH